ncbi:MAG: glycosyltransferase family 1 protein [Treponema sp.]|nr:glycosyltransferase family 4 protein [Treponema sp.]MEE3314133.1 glycosyltransferase family 1 protein [Treponema sp.]
MKVGIDTFGCDHGRSGIGTYLMSLVRNLPENKNNGNMDIEFELFGAEMDRFTFTGDKSFKFESVAVPESLVAERYWHTFKVNSFGKKHGYDAIVYSAGPRMLPRSFKVPGIAVVHDIVSNLFEQSDDFWFRRQMKKGLSHADCIITPSQYIKKDLERSGIRCRKIEVIHNGIDHSLFYPRTDLGDGEEIVDIKPFAIKRPYIIYASRMQNEGKKHVELVKAFSMFKEKTGLPHRLVLAGSEGAYGEMVHKAIFDSSFSSDIFVTGYFPHENFPELYRNADACVFPSVTEGVGLSVLEAMACGIPVACSQAGAMGEMAGSNALFFDSENLEEMSDAIEKIVCDSALRKKLSADGLEWTKRFSWEKTAAATLELLKNLSEK